LLCYATATTNTNAQNQNLEMKNEKCFLKIESSKKQFLLFIRPLLAYILLLDFSWPD
jgi:hypothetical protein